ncbi:putative RNA-binding protein 15B [Xiphias gladius]|uniref:putative RNA-binding protein 15B n=1 Tax=Xiphias gladius TaxID=8245 RepID=UPI001A9953C6|nr:putative RNA-binding protein 15B [Xiphias gladius]
MKRQAGRETSPPRAVAKRIRERERESARREELPPPPPPPLALLLAESRGYHRRSRSREREKPRIREERAAALELHHRHELSLLGRPPLRTTAAELPAARPGTLEYKTLLISNLGSQVSDEDVEDALFHEFKKFGDVSVKLSHTPELGRIAYVNFRHPEDAKEARHAKSSRLVLGERQLKIEPMYVRRRSVTPPDVGYLPLHAPYPYRQRSLSPPGPGVSNIRDLRARHYALETLGLSRERERLLDYYGMLDERGRPYGFPPMPVVEDLKPEDDQRATSNLFIGNLDGNVTEAELRRGFDKYGIIEDVVIKRPARGQGGAYAFVPKFSSHAGAWQQEEDARRAGGVEAFGRSGRGARSRSRSRERWLKEREERRSRRRSRSRSLSADRQTEERDREREKERGRSRVRGLGGVVSPDVSPDRARVRAPDSTTEPRDHSPDSGGGGRHSAANEEDPPSGRHHGKRSSSAHLNNHHHRNSEVVAASSPALHTDTHNTSSPSTLSEFAQASLSKAWHGFFALKNSSFPTDLYLLEGGPSFFNTVMKESLKLQSQNQPSQLKIAQRLRMDQTRLDEVSRRIKLGRPDGFAILLALQGPIDRQAPAPEPGLQVRLLRHLVTYLRNKEAAGVVSLPAAKEGGPGAMLYAFPPGDFSQQYLQAAKRTVGNLDEEHMVIVIVTDTN